MDEAKRGPKDIVGEDEGLVLVTMRGPEEPKHLSTWVQKKSCLPF